MGGLTSKLFHNMLEEEEREEPGTPVTFKKKILPTDFDPRSPSCDITRTPIQVEKTPDMVIDPRSPTSGIARTPIYGNNKPEQKFVGADTPVFPLDLKPDLGAEDLQLSSFEDLEEELELLSRSSSEPDLSLKQDEVELLPTKQVPVSQSYKESSNLKHRSKKHFIGHTNTVPTEESPQKADKGQRSPLKVIGGDGQRSPLSVRNKDVNSPRAIVQRKQVNKLGMMRCQVTSNAMSSNNSKNKGSPAKYQLFSDDKENS